MAMMKTLLILASICYFVTVITLFYFLPSLRNFQRNSQTDYHLVIHKHVLAARNAEAKCQNLTDRQLYSPVIQMVKVGQDLHILSAYYDKRLPDNHYIRIIVLMNFEHRAKVNLHCHLNVNYGQIFTMPATLYELNENHNRPYRGYIFSCPVPSKLAAKLPICTVHVTDGTLSKDPGARIVLVEVPRRFSAEFGLTRGHKYNFTVCLPPIYGSVNAFRFIEFIEMTRILGAEHFFLYNFDALTSNNDLTRALHYYQERGLLTLRKWELPVSHSSVWYYGQALAIHQCLYENMGLSRYTVFQDMDELIIPRHKDTWSQLLAEIDSGSHCGFRIFSVFFEPQDGPIMSLASLSRSVEVSRFRTKCIVHPELIFEMGIHHISKQNIEERTPENVDETKVLVHHYRKCDRMFSMNCRDKVNDMTIRKYDAQLSSAFNKSVSYLKLK